MWEKIANLFKSQEPEQPKQVPELSNEELEKMFNNNAAVQEMKKNQSSYIKLRMENTRGITQKNSKLGGVGYIPKTEPYPFSVDGVPLTLLAQINFSEMPNLVGYPTEGILAVYLDYYDSIMGMDPDEPTNTDRFRVLYFSDTDAEGYSIEDINNIINSFDQSEWYPVVNREQRLVGTLDKEYPFISRESFLENFSTDVYDFCEEEFGEYGDQVAYYVLEKYRPLGHKIGGYPLFFQEDTRVDGQTDYTKLLLQIDSDVWDGTGEVREAEEDVVRWSGDDSTGKFFITEENLRNLKFDDVHYSWDSL